MQVSVFTPSHDPRYLADCYRSLRAQTHTDWEWVVYLNGPSRSWQPPQADPRVVVRCAPTAVRGVGAAKRLACEIAGGDILVELDHDDLLTPTCLAEVRQAFLDHPDASLVYSDSAQVRADLSPDPTHFGSAYGWEYSEERDRGRALRALPRDGADPAQRRLHLVRAEPRAGDQPHAYDEAGGYDAALEVLDDQELMIRLFTLGDFHHLPRCLYLQRMHGATPRSTRTPTPSSSADRRLLPGARRRPVHRLGGTPRPRHRHPGAGSSHMLGAPDTGDVVVLDPSAPRCPSPTAASP